MKKGAFDNTTDAYNFKQAKHVDPQEYIKLREQVNLCTGSVNLWLARDPENNRPLAKSLTAIMRSLLRQDAFSAYAMPFQLSIYSDTLPSSVQSEPSFPPCRFAQDVLTCHHLLLRELIDQQHIPLANPNANTTPAYPKYDEWLVAAAELVNEDSMEIADLEFYDLPSDFPKDPQEIKREIQSIIAESEQRVRQTQFINSYFSSVCPICDELLRLKRAH